MNVVAIIVAAGRGSRAGEGVPKQYREIGGKPVLARTLSAFLSHPRVGRVLCAIHPDDRARYDGVAAGLGGLAALLEPVTGGDTRQTSVHRAIETISDNSATICLVHDGARPFIGADVIERAIEACRLYGAAIPGTVVTDTTKRVDADGNVVETLDRTALRAIQTPQAFTLATLLSAHRAAAETGRYDFTDDGHLVEWAGSPVHVFEGDPLNTKVTHASDFVEAERRLGSGAGWVTRVATGFDVHAFAPGDHVWLGGLRIAHDVGVMAHSDGDVVLHALTDALLGTLGEGDIGTHFPPSDPQWKGAASDRFLAFAAEQVRAQGGRIDHLDVTVLCERPKVGPHRDAMRDRIAAIVGVPPRSVSIKATTTERLGFTGRSEGLAAQAAATVRLPE